MLLLSLFKYKAWANDELLSQLEKVSSPEERHLSIRLLNHIYVVDCIFAAHLTGQKHNYNASNTPEAPTLGELSLAVKALDYWYIDYVSHLRPEQLTEKLSFVFTDQAHGQMTREEILAHIITHGGYHRGAVGRIMTQASVQPPRDIFTAYLHQSEPERRLAQ